MPLDTTNTFSPLADHEEEEYQIDNTPVATEPVDGWADVITVSTASTVDSTSSQDIQDKKPRAKKKKLKAKKKQQQIKVKLPKTGQTLTGPAGCELDLALLGMLSAPSGLQQAAISLGSPSKYFGSSFSSPHGRGGGGHCPSSRDLPGSPPVITQSPADPKQLTQSSFHSPSSSVSSFSPSSVNARKPAPPILPQKSLPDNSID